MTSGGGVALGGVALGGVVLGGVVLGGVALGGVVNFSVHSVVGIGAFRLTLWRPIAGTGIFRDW